MNYNYVFWIQSVSLFFVCCSIPLYISVIYTLMRYRRTESHLQNSFFVLWISLGVTDLSHATSFWLSGKLPLMGAFPSLYKWMGQRTAGAIMYFVFTTHFNQVFGIGLLSINRFTALLMPRHSEQNWTKPWLIPVCLCVCWALSAAMASPILVMSMDWQYSTNMSKIAFHFLSTDLAAMYMFWVGVLLATVASSIVLVYAFMFYRVRKMSLKQQKALDTQIKLATCAFLVATFLALLAICFCIFSFYTENLLWGDNAVLFFISCDLNSFCNAYLLLATSHVVRKMTAKLIPCAKLRQRAQRSEIPDKTPKMYIKNNSHRHSFSIRSMAIEMKEFVLDDDSSCRILTPPVMRECSTTSSYLMALADLPSNYELK